MSEILNLEAMMALNRDQVMEALITAARSLGQVPVTETVSIDSPQGTFTFTAQALITGMYRLVDMIDDGRGAFASVPVESVDGPFIGLPYTALLTMAAALTRTAPGSGVPEDTSGTAVDEDTSGTATDEDFTGGEDTGGEDTGTEHVIDNEDFVVSPLRARAGRGDWDDGPNYNLYLIGGAVVLAALVLLRK